MTELQKLSNWRAAYTTPTWFFLFYHGMNSFKRWTEVMIYKDLVDISQAMVKSGAKIDVSGIPETFQTVMLYIMPRLQRVTFSEWLFRNTFFLADTLMAMKETQLKYAAASTEVEKKLKANEELANWLNLQGWWFGQMLSFLNLANSELSFHIEKLVAKSQFEKIPHAMMLMSLRGVWVGYLLMGYSINLSTGQANRNAKATIK